MKELTILCNDPEEILSQEIDRIKEEMGADYSPGKVNLAELERRTGITRGKLRRLQKNNFEFLPNGNKGKKHEVTIISGYTGVIGNCCPRCGRHSGEGVSVEKLRELRKKYPNMPHFVGID